MNKIIFFFALICCFLSLNAQNTKPWDGDIDTDFQNGNGSQENPFIIASAQQLALLAKLVNEGNDFQNNYFILKNDIDLGGTSENPFSWTPIGNNENKFQGCFEGNNKTIANLYINNKKLTYAGIFGEIGIKGSIQNLGIIGNTFIYISKTKDVLFGCLASLCFGIIDNCYNSSNIDIETVDATNTCIGGIVSSAGTIYNSYNSGNIIAKPSSESKIGGIVGKESFILNCFNSGDITSENVEKYTNIGGIDGYQSKVYNCYNSGTIQDIPKSYANVCGISGNCRIVKNCYNKGIIEPNVQLNEHGIGISKTTDGLTTRLKNCYNIGKVNGQAITQRFYVPDNIISNSFYLNGNSSDDIYGTKLNAEQMKSADFVTTLNSDSNKQIWFQDNDNPVNNGFPILYWQKKDSIKINILQAANGFFTVSKNGWNVKDGDLIKHCAILKINANPDKDFFLKFILVNGIPVSSIDNTVLIEEDAVITVVFDFAENMQYWDGSIADNFGGGIGSEDNPFLINTPQQLAFLAQKTNKDLFDGGSDFSGKYFKLINNISLQNQNGDKFRWTPIGLKESSDSPEFIFNGNLDGNGKIITGINIFIDFINDPDYENFGLFGIIGPKGAVRNLGITGRGGFEITRNVRYIGFIAAINRGIIENCYNTLDMKEIIHRKEIGYPGGIAGLNEGKVNNCYNRGNIDADNVYKIGGIVSINASENGITNCYSTGFFRTEQQGMYRGYIAGDIESNSASISNCYYDNSSFGAKGGIRNTDIPEWAEGKTTQWMKSAESINALNSSQTDSPWVEDNNYNTNNGYPILKWQKSSLSINNPEQLDAKIYTFNKTVYINTDTDTQITINITDITGRVIKHITTENPNTQLQIQTPGIYIINVKSIDKQTTKKVIIN